MISSKQDINILLIAIIFVINYLAIVSFTKIDGTQFIPTLLLLFLFFYFFRDKFFRKCFLSKLTFIWGVLMFYQWWNAIRIGSFNAENTTPLYALLNGIRTYLLLLLVAFCFVKAAKKTVKYLMTGYLIYTILLFIQVSSGNDVIDGRANLSGIMYVNQLGQLAGVCSLFISVYFLYYKQNLFKAFLLYLIPLSLVIETQSRNAFIILFFAYIIFLLGIYYKSKNKRILIILYIFVILYFVLSFIPDIADNKYIYQILNRENAIVGKDSDVTGTWIDRILGDRVVYYVIGFNNFIHNTLFGIGLWGFKDYNSYNYSLHSEYMVHLAEGGLIGGVLFFLFLKNYLLGLIQFKKNIHFLPFFLIFLTILIIGLTARIFCYEFFFPIYGILSGYILKSKYSYKGKSGKKFPISLLNSKQSNEEDK